MTIEVETGSCCITQDGFEHIMWPKVASNSQGNSLASATQGLRLHMSYHSWKTLFCLLSLRQYLMQYIIASSWLCGPATLDLVVSPAKLWYHKFGLLYLACLKFLPTNFHTRIRNSFWSLYFLVRVLLYFPNWPQTEVKPQSQAAGTVDTGHVPLAFLT